MDNKSFSHKITIFHGRRAPEEGLLVGYGALINAFKLNVTIPDKLALISSKTRQYKTDQWIVLTPRHTPEDSLYKQLIFAIKYEGINLLFFKKLFEKLTENDIIELIQIEPLGQYSRKIWFLYEWLNLRKLPIKDLKNGNFVSIIDSKLQYCLNSDVNKSSRHRIINNLPGTVYFCPLIFKTDKLENHIKSDLSAQNSAYLNTVLKSVLQRASAFLLLKDSKASFTIEGETPGNNRAVRWGKVIGQAGGNELSNEEFNRLQQIIIEANRFIELGFRKKGGFVGEHDRETATPLPEHISARWQDLEQLMNGLLSTNTLLENKYDAVLSAAVIAFGFVFIHPFEDGNGRLHRYIIHHILAQRKFSHQGIIFPISASILDHIDDYRKVLESYSHSILDFIEWKETEDHNIEVLNETMDFYRYFDATKQAEFLYDCVEDTLKRVIPEEINYLQAFDLFKTKIENLFEMPDKMIALLVNFLEQNNGSLSNRAKFKEFQSLTKSEVTKIENIYRKIFELKV